ncbi:hypothetical protein D9T17_16895 [Lysobacter enzymogenes]|uniref:Uncharacterized protein n=1 Tax=Lysobacter enzymogenes TaxID=69 RepID=A0A3N2REH3_LYSEN|nr:hypothetical protein D9T17_16895 [Lysobacter enzymogenes]
MAQWADRVQGDERLLIQALATRHWDGHVRERHLRSILPFQRDWLAAFVVQLLGEYVVEIAQAILASIDELDSALYGAFVKENPGFMATTERRVVSYWNCYYRHAGYKYREEYPAMVALRAIQRMAQ